MKINTGIIVVPTLAFGATAIFVHFLGQECSSCKITNPEQLDKVKIGNMLNLGVKSGKKGALVVVVGECKSCSMKQVNMPFLASCSAAGYKVTFVESAFDAYSSKKFKTSYNEIPVITLPYMKFRELTTSFLPRLILLDKDQRVLRKQTSIDEVMELPSG